MLMPDSEKTRPELSHTTTVNKAALSAWLQAWTTGASFSAAVPVVAVDAPPQTVKELLARLRHVVRAKNNVG